MTQHERELSNLSYTNKDFQTIYPELLELAKKISYKWNPIESDESDPGVVLLKLAALMTDKLNYNIDKNILELYPLSVTQDTNARQLFDQCGYSMRYYQSATTSVTFSMTNEPEVTEDDIAKLAPNSAITLEDLSRSAYTRSYTLPMFTMVSDIDNNIVYTTIEDAIIKSDSTSVSVDAIQGIIQDYTINGQVLITAANLDYNNRLYFTETDIAENGIFISNESGYNYKTWKKVDNLILQPLNTPCYKFGLTENGSMCYIEFPSDIDSIIGSGITIKYIRTRGAEGNIGRKRIAQFYTDTNSTRRFTYESANSANIQSIQLTSENVSITNSFASVDGKDPETIEDAYRNYQRVKSTFDTLVSLKDYTDFLYTNKNYSNGFVCDRTNDIQSSYKVVENRGTYTRTHTLVRDNELTAFDLRVYGLTYVDNVTTAAGYSKSFTVLEDTDTLATDWHQIKVDTLNIKSIQHDFQDYIPNRPILFKNKFPIKAKIIPQYKLIDAQKQDVLAKVETALCSTLNSRNRVFGEEIEYDVVYDTIMNCDPRIKALILDDFEYETYVVYKSSDNVISEIRIDKNSTQPKDPAQAALWHEFRVDICARCVLAGVSQLLNAKNDFVYSLEHKNPIVKDDVYKITTLLQFSIGTNDTNKGEDVYFQTSDGGETYFAFSEVLQENENLILTAPNLVNDETYSSYCKFIHNIQQTASGSRTEDTFGDVVVTSNEEYRLRDGEFIVFFWKTEDDDSLPYSYIKYDSESDINIISPTFSLTIQKNPEGLLDLPMDKLKNLPSGKGTTQFQTMSDGTSMTDYISKLQGSTYVLTGSNTIYTKKPNAIKITDSTVGTRNVYWILNKTQKATNDKGEIVDSSLLFEDTRGKPADDVGNTYILQSGEYFMYSNASKTHLTMLGSGTKITRTKSGSPWRVDAIDYDEFIATGVDYLDTKWFEVPTSTDVVATEMLFHQLGPGNRLKLVTNRTLMPSLTDAPARIVFTNDGIIQGNGKIVIDPVTGDAKFEQNYIKLHEYVISFIDEDGNETWLANRHAADLAWDGYSLLNINVSPSIPQRLGHGHTIILYDEDGKVIEDGVFTSSYNTTDEVDENITKKIEFLANRELNLTGGRNIDATSVSLGNVITPTSIYLYDKNLVGSDDGQDAENVTYIDSQMSVYATSGTNTVATFPVCLLPGKYVLPMTISENVIKTISFDIAATTSSGVVSMSYHDFAALSLSEVGTHYLYFTVTEDVSSITATLTVEAEKDTTIVFDSPYRYEEAFDENLFTDIASKCSQFDKEHVFNYTQEVPEDLLIKDPLESIKFFDTDHVFNPYTIGMWQWTTASSGSKENDIFVVDKVK